MIAQSQIFVIKISHTLQKKAGAANDLCSAFSDSFFKQNNLSVYCHR